MPRDSLPDRSDFVRRVIADHAKTGDPYTGDGAEWLVVYAAKRGVTEDELASAALDDKEPS